MITDTQHSDAHSRSYGGKLLILFVGCSISTLYLWSSSCVCDRIHSPPHEDDYHHLMIAIEQAISGSDLPAASALDQRSQQILDEANGISYSPAEGLTYKYDKPYTYRETTLMRLTFGQLGIPDVKATAAENPPDMLRQNARLRGAHQE